MTKSIIHDVPTADVGTIVAALIAAGAVVTAHQTATGFYSITIERVRL
jgi:hypothetical protein